MIEQNYTPRINPIQFDFVISKLREFFKLRGFCEVYVQNQLQILAACEDPSTMKTYEYNGQIWPLPQTGQMHLEYILLENPDSVGFFTVSTSFRDEKSPIEGRHNKIFPMFEFESAGDINDLIKLESDLVEFLGFSKPWILKYDDVCDIYNTDEVEHEHEQKLEEEYGTVLLSYFPERSNPFWNMKKNSDGLYNKIDVIIGGMETIGSAERSCNVEEMMEGFKNIEDGKYSEQLYSSFGEERLNKELYDYFDLDFIPRIGGGIGITRLISAMEKYDLFPNL